MDYLLVCKNGIRVHEGAATFFDGIGVFGNRLVISGDQPSSADRGRGTFMIARTKPCGTITVEADPLGIYPIFYFNEGGLFALSNNVYLLTSTLGRLGRPIAKDVSLHAQFITIGTGIDHQTGHKDIRLLPVGAVVTVTPENRVSISKQSAADILYSDRPLADLLDEAAEEMLGNIRAIASAPYETRACDLSGGMDSRLVVAAILHEKVQDAFLFKTHNNYPNADANTAALIRKQFGLRRGADFEPPSSLQLTPHEKMCRVVGRLGGLMEMFYNLSNSSEEANKGSISVSGALGELFREFYAATPETDTPLSGIIKRTQLNAKLLRKKTVASQQQALLDMETKLAAEGIRREHISAAFYMAGRNRYHFGATARATAPGRIHPLYSLAAIKAAHAIPDDERRANRVGYELMRRFCPELVTVPFADKSWDPLIMRGAPPPITKASPRFGDPKEPIVRVFRRPKSKTSSDIQNWTNQLIAGGMRTSSAKFAMYLEDFRRNVTTPNYSALEPVFNPWAAKRFLGEEIKSFANGSSAAMGYRLLGAYIWANDLETTDQHSGVPLPSQ